MWQAVKEKRCIHWEHWSYDTGFETEQENSGNISSLCNVASLQQVNVQWSKVWLEPQFYPLSFYFTNFRAFICNSFSCSLVSKLLEFTRLDVRTVFYSCKFVQTNQFNWVVGTTRVDLKEKRNQSRNGGRNPKQTDNHAERKGLHYVQLNFPNNFVVWITLHVQTILRSNIMNSNQVKPKGQEK